MALNYKINKELHKYKVLSVPKYDDTTQQFVIDNSLPSADKFFESENKQQQHWSFKLKST